LPHTLVSSFGPYEEWEQSPPFVCVCFPWSFLPSFFSHWSCKKWMSELLWKVAGKCWNWLFYFLAMDHHRLGSCRHKLFA
jgi:hypothetical protein